MSDNRSIYISVIIATYNAAQTFEETILSIINQTNKSFELIIIDANSNDATVEIIRKYNKHIAYWVSEPDQGIYDAWNKGILVAKGDWISFIGSDDYLFDSNVFTKVISFLQKANQLGIQYVYGKIIKVNPTNPGAIQYYGKPWKDYQSKILANMCMGHWASFHKATLFKEYGLFNADFKISGDYEFLLRIFKQNKNIGLFADTVTVAIVREGGVSGNMKQLLQMALEQKKARSINSIKSFSFKLESWIIQIKILQLIEKMLGRNSAKKIFSLYKFLKNIIVSKY
jgi:glycosyltransferase involved in cell wall biosynthesis